MPTKLSAYRFGQAMGVKVAAAVGSPGGLLARQKQSFSFMPEMAAHGAAGLGAAGAGLGGLIGAGYGAYAPGEETRDGKKVKRDRLMGALRGLAAGGLIGGGVGAAGGGGYGAYQGYMMDQMPESKLINAMEGVTNFIEAAKSKSETSPGFQKATEAGKSLWDAGKSVFDTGKSVFDKGESIFGQ